jgi:methylmalonyl-CoA/ethylmalonyl-CoA epimerase
VTHSPQLLLLRNQSKLASEAGLKMRFHHLGVATDSLQRDLGAYRALGYRPEGAVVVDERQGVKGLFLVGGGPRLELLEPLPGSDTLAPFLSRGIKCYHHAYEVESLENSLAALRAAGAKQLAPPVDSAPLNRQIVFLVLPNRWIVELIG